MKATFSILLLVCLLTAALFPVSAIALQDYSAASLSSQEQILVNLIKEDRARYGRSIPTLDPALCAVAKVKAEEMRDLSYCGHTSPNYGNIRQMLTAFGVSYAGASENVARYRSVLHCEAAFLSSPGHRQTLLSTAWTRMGVGVAVTSSGFVYVCQIFAR